MAMTFLCKSQNDLSVMYDPFNSHAATHFDDTQGLKELTIEAIGRVDLEGEKYERAIDMGRAIGNSDVVQVESGDEIVYAVRRNRETDGLVPFVKHKTSQACSTVALSLYRDGDRYILHSAWIGTIGGDDEPFPQASDATARSQEFWNKRAFIWGSQQIIDESLTVEYPWD